MIDRTHVNGTLLFLLSLVSLNKEFSKVDEFSSFFD